MMESLNQSWKRLVKMSYALLMVKLNNSYKIYSTIFKIIIHRTNNSMLEFIVSMLVKSSNDV